MQRLTAVAYLGGRRLCALRNDEVPRVEVASLDAGVASDLRQQHLLEDLIFFLFLAGAVFLIEHAFFGGQADQQFRGPIFHLHVRLEEEAVPRREDDVPQLDLMAARLDRRDHLDVRIEVIGSRRHDDFLHAAVIPAGDDIAAFAGRIRWQAARVFADLECADADLCRLYLDSVHDLVLIRIRVKAVDAGELDFLNDAALPFAGQDVTFL